MSDFEFTEKELQLEQLLLDQETLDPSYDFPVGDSSPQNDNSMLLADNLPVSDFTESTSNGGDTIKLDDAMKTRAEIASIIENMPEEELSEYICKILEETHPSVRDLLEIYLVIDDDDGHGELASMVLRRLLRESPAVVVYFRDSVHAVNFFRNSTHGRVKGIVSDYHMPALNGIDVLQAVRGTDHGQDVPFVLMSMDLKHHPDFPKLIHFVERNGAKYEPKPMGFSELKDAIQRSLFEGRLPN